MSDSEPDFDDPRFLVDVEPAPEQLTYQQKRLKSIGRGREKAAATQKRSRHEMEEQAREEGLRTNLIAKNTLEAGTVGESKALKMMKGMGFTPGESLGRKRTPPAAEAVPNKPAADETAPTRGGLGFSRSSTASGSSTPAVAPAITEPIKFELRDRRTGLGVPQAKRMRPFPSNLLPGGGSSAEQAMDPEALSAYLASVKSTVNDRKVHGYLRSLRRTCEELDRRAGIEESIMWRDPDEESRQEDKAFRRRAFLRGDADYDAELGVDVEAERAREDDMPRRTALSYEQGLSETVIDNPEEDENEAQRVKAEQEEWFSMDVGTRMGLTMDYLRRKYFYCLFCGCQYDNAEDLADNCPGLAEDDH